jgi:putative transposase
MPFRQNIFEQGQYYHIFNRGVNRQKIFFTKENYLYFLKLLNKHRISSHATVIAYCLMPNHYHLLLRQDSDINLSRFMKAVLSAYVQALNKYLERKGPLFEGRFKHVHVDNDEYVLHLCRYIHLNPVIAGYVRTQRSGYSQIIENG